MLLDPVAKSKINIFCYYESNGVLGVGHIVPQASAVLPQYGNAPIAANHIDMTKFVGSDEEGFILVAELINMWLDKTKESSDSRTSG